MFKFTNLLDVDEVDMNTTYIEKKKSRTQTPWVDKYRPKTIDDIVQQDEVVKFLKESLKTNNMPHLLLHGPPGTGKTSCILAIANQLFGPIKVHERVIELNASDDSGINAVRHKIITFAETKLSNGDPNYPSPQFKIVILDEADAMTTEAQSALRKVMEDLSKITRFCFICNYINQIIEPIASRCMKFRFKPIDNSLMNDKISYIAKKEHMLVPYNVIDAISTISKGDVRRSIMTLQNLKYVLNYKSAIDVNDVYEITNMLPQEIIDKIWSICVSTDDDIIPIINLTNDMKEFGFPSDNILEQIKNKVINSSLSDEQKSLICVQLGTVERRLIEGADEYIQMLNIFSYMKGIISGSIDYFPSSAVF